MLLLLANINTLVLFGMFFPGRGTSKIEMHDPYHDQAGNSVTPSAIMGLDSETANGLPI